MITLALRYLYSVGKATIRKSVGNQQEAQLMLTNPRDAVRCPPRSPNIELFHMLGIVFYISVKW